MEQYLWNSSSILNSYNSFATNSNSIDLALSNDGKYQIIALKDNAYNIYVSRNYGVSFTQPIGDIASSNIDFVLISGIGDLTIAIDTRNIRIFYCHVDSTYAPIVPYIPENANNWPTGPNGATGPSSVGQALDMIAGYFSTLRAASAAPFVGYPFNP
jgi:hypothetical protein